VAGHPGECGVNFAPKVLILKVGINLKADIKLGRNCPFQAKFSILILAIAFEMWIMKLKIINSDVDLLSSLQIKTSQ
jgi:hypothetical protein